MAETHLANELGPLGESPPDKVNGAVQGGRLLRFRATITMDEQADGDDIILARIPAGLNFAFGVITTTTSLADAEVSIGYGEHFDEYRATAAFTATNTPTLFGKAAAVAEGPNDEAREVRMLIAEDDLPSSGTLVVDLYYSKA